MSGETAKFVRFRICSESSQESATDTCRGSCFVVPLPSFDDARALVFACVRVSFNANKIYFPHRRSRHRDYRRTPTDAAGELRDLSFNTLGESNLDSANSRLFRATRARSLVSAIFAGDSKMKNSLFAPIGDFSCMLIFILY